ncbi:unnamed protein product, partial [Iphiclides podalirius]
MNRRKKVSPNKKMIIIIDTGHGGLLGSVHENYDNGAAAYVRRAESQLITSLIFKAIMTIIAGSRKSQVDCRLWNFDSCTASVRLTMEWRELERESLHGRERFSSPMRRTADSFRIQTLLYSGTCSINDVMMNIRSIEMANYINDRNTLARRIAPAAWTNN